MSYTIHVYRHILDTDYACIRVMTHMTIQLQMAYSYIHSFIRHLEHAGIHLSQSHLQNCAVALNCASGQRRTEMKDKKCLNRKIT